MGRNKAGIDHIIANVAQVSNMTYKPLVQKNKWLLIINAKKNVRHRK